MIEDLAGNDDLVGAGSVDEVGEAAPDGGRRSNDRRPQHMLQLGPLERRERRVESSGSSGGGTGPSVPRRSARKICWCDVNSRRASSSVSAATTLTPSITCGRSELLRMTGWNASR